MNEQTSPTEDITELMQSATKDLQKSVSMARWATLLGTLFMVVSISIVWSEIQRKEYYPTLFVALLLLKNAADVVRGSAVSLQLSSTHRMVLAKGLAEYQHHCDTATGQAELIEILKILSGELEPPPAPSPPSPRVRKKKKHRLA